MQDDDTEKSGMAGEIVVVSAGVVLQGRYRLLERLGSGGMGEAWKASDSRRLVDGQPALVVIKLLPGELRLNEEANEDIRREYSRVWLLSHPHICKLFDMGEQDGVGCFQVMQYLPGLTLRQWLRHHPQGLHVEHVIPVLRAAAAAFDYAHTVRRPVVHRDVKPENIMLNLETGEVHVIDFGLAAEIRSSQTKYSSSNAVIAGTLGYMSPEQWQGVPATAACDQWALGIVAWELLAGTRPFQGVGMALGYAVVESQLPQLPAPLAYLQEVFQRVLNKKSSARFRNCSEFINQLEAYAEAHHAEDRVAMPAPVLSSARPQKPDILVAPFSAHAASAAQISWARFLDRDVQWRDEFGQEFRLIPPGEYMMGGTETVDQLLQAGFMLPNSGWKDWIEAESPAHTVRINRPFLLGLSPVTHMHFDAFVRATGYQTGAESVGKGGWGYVSESRSGVQKSGFNWKITGFEQSALHPVVNVSWHDAHAYVQWLNDTVAGTGAGIRYRLPYEAEWEHACRAGTNTRFFTGDSPDSLQGFANVQDESFLDVFPNVDLKKWQSFPFNDLSPFTSPVGQYAANPFGLQDMLGNVWEWCEDFFEKNYYSVSPADDPKGPATGTTRVLRGGCWGVGPVQTRSSGRDYYGPGHRSYFIGFRIVAELSEDRRRQS